MSKQKKTTTQTEDNFPTASIGTPDTQLVDNSIIGKKITLNQKKETFFKVGPIFLNTQHYTCTIPSDLTPLQLNIITRSLADGTIQFGEHLIPPIDKDPSVPNEYWTLLRATSFQNKDTKKKFSMLLRTKSDRGWTAYEIAAYCLAKETEYKRRDVEIRLLSEVIENYDGERILYEPPVNNMTN